MAVVLRCPACREKFKYDVTKGWPDNCPLCKEDINNYRADDDVVMPAFLSQKSKNNDKVARDIMDGSETRVDMAAAMAGTTREEMAGLKITNLNDRKDAQFAAMDVVNPVTQRMAEMQARGLQTGFGVAEAQHFATQAHAPVVVDGKPRPLEPYAGLRARNRVQSALQPIGQAPLPRQITDNPNYRSPV
jgi:hypothetical protein